MHYSEVAEGVPFSDGDKVFAYYSSEFPCIEGFVEEITYTLKGGKLEAYVKLKNFTEKIIGKYVMHTEEELLNYLQEGILAKKIILE